METEEPSDRGPAATLSRVKVYKLGNQGEWKDCGTGYVSVEFLENCDPPAMGLMVLGEENKKLLLCHRISMDDIYQTASENTIITWHDIDQGTELALSFQEPLGCEHIWKQIKRVQQELIHASREKDNDFEQQSKGQFDVEFQYGDDKNMDLPMPDLNNIEEISKVLCLASPFQRERLAISMIKPGWIPALLDLFKQCEDLEDTTTLAHIFRAVRAAIMLNDAAVLEELLKEEYVMDVVGALEYDPELHGPQRHRTFLSASVVFKEVVPIKEPAVLAKIHQTYRIQYIKDVILPRSLDDATYATLSSLALFNNVEVVSALAGDPEFLQQLFEALDKTDPKQEAWADLVAFLQEFCNLARHLQQDARRQLFGKLVQLGLFEQVTKIMRVGSEAVKLKATDVLLSVLQHDTLALRNFLRTQPDNALMGLLVHEFNEGPVDGGLPEQVAELLKMLLDPETMDEPLEKNEFVDMFYDKHINRILDVILTDRAINPRDGSRDVPATTLALIVDLMSFCVQHHTLRVGYFTLRNHLVEKVVNVIRRKERWLACAAVRFLRTCVISSLQPMQRPDAPSAPSKPNEYLTRYLVRNNVFEPVMRAFFENGDRYNMLNSATLDLIEYIRAKNAKELIKHLIDQYGHKFQDMDFARVFQDLKIKHDQIQDAEEEERTRSERGAQGAQQDAAQAAAAAGAQQGQGSGAAAALRGRFAFSATGEPLGYVAGAGGLVPQRRRRDQRELDRDEEEYFDTEDDGEEGAGGDEGPLLGGQLGSRAGRGSAGAHTAGSPSSSGRSSAGEAGTPGLGRAARSPAGAQAGGASPGQPWLGLTEYGDSDDEEGAGQGKQEHQQQQEQAGSQGAGSAGQGGTPPQADGPGGLGEPRKSKSLKSSVEDSPGHPRSEGSDTGATAGP